MSIDEINEFTEAIDKQNEELLERVIEKAKKRNIDLAEGITSAFILFINEED